MVKNWHDICRRLSSAEKAAAAIRPDPDPDNRPVDWAAILTPEDKERLRVIRECYLALSLPKGKLIETATDDELDFLIVVAERIEAWREGEEAMRA